MNCKRCGTTIDETHVTERIEREGESIERHYCSPDCLALDNGYRRAIVPSSFPPRHPRVPNLKLGEITVEPTDDDITISTSGSSGHDDLSDIEL